MIKQHVISACRQLLGPIARLLIRNGVTFSEFTELGKQVYVDVARRDYGLQGRPTNTARVAMLTGLSRREVSRVRQVTAGLQPARPATQSRLSMVLSAWYLEPDYQDSEGRPAMLSDNGREPTIQSLLRRHAGDLPHGALLKEMIQLGLAERSADGYRARKRSYVRNPADPDIVRQAGQALYDHGCTLVHNLDAQRDNSARFERMASTTRLARADLGPFHSFVEQHGQAFLEAVDAWLADHATEPAAATDTTLTVRAGVGMYLIQDDNYMRSDE